MANKRRARPVSGEIMTAAAPKRGRRPEGDVVDADFEVLARASSRTAPVEDGQAVSAPAPTPASGVTSTISQSTPAMAPPWLEGMDMLRRPEAVPARPPSRGGPLFWTGGFALILAAFWVSGGDALTRRSPLLAEQEKVALSITGITSRVDMSGEKPVLFVDGEAANDGAKEAALPPLAISVAGNDGSITRYTLGTSGRPLAPGQRFAFSSRLDLPRNGVKTVSVTFAE